MERHLFSWIGMSALLAVTLPVMAQAPDIQHMRAHPSIHIVNAPATPNTPTGILPYQYKAAYGFNQIPNQGAGMTIALVDAYKDPNVVSDLAFYANYFRIGPCNFTVVDLATVEGQGWDLEESLDVQQACALAPQANIVLVEAASDSLTDLLDAVAVASAAPYNASVVSMGWGGAEFSGELADDSYFCNIVNGIGQPVTFVASEGGSCGTPTYPATSSCVVAVGGTALTLSTTTPSTPLQIIYGSQTAYGGGGLSLYEAQPPLQRLACAQYSSTARCVPDVSADASPATGVPVYDTYSYGGWVQVGGISVPTVDWASFFTLVNSLRVIHNMSPLSQAGPDLYTVYNSSNYLTDFHDITGGSGLCQAVPGYDLATGIGTYQANHLYSPLVADPN